MSVMATGIKLRGCVLGCFGKQSPCRKVRVKKVVSRVFNDVCSLPALCFLRSICPEGWAQNIFFSCPYWSLRSVTFQFWGCSKPDREQKWFYEPHLPLPVCRETGGSTDRWQDSCKCSRNWPMEIQLIKTFGCAITANVWTEDYPKTSFISTTIHYTNNQDESDHRHSKSTQLWLLELCCVSLHHNGSCTWSMGALIFQFMRGPGAHFCPTAVAIALTSAESGCPLS